jgi:hypothetical protein
MRMGAHVSPEGTGRRQGTRGRCGRVLAVALLFVFAAAVAACGGTAEAEREIEASPGVDATLPAGGARVRMSSGLSFVLPGGMRGQLVQYAEATGLPGALTQELRPTGGSEEAWSVTISALAPPLAESRGPLWETLAERGELIAGDASEHVRVYWVESEGWVLVLSTLPGRDVGLLLATGVSVDDADAALREAREVWEEYQGEGVPFPQRITST